MIRSTVQAFGMCCLCTAVTAQSADSSRWGAVHVGGGAFVVADAPLFRNDLGKLAPGSSFLDRDLTDHKFSNDTYERGTGAFEIAISLLPFKRSDRQGPELRLGVTYAGLSYQSAALRRTVRTPYDTLTSSQTGEQFLLDSVQRDNIWMDRYAERVGVGASLIWRTKGRWSLYGGVGVSGGLVLNGRTELRQDQSRSVEPNTLSSGRDDRYGFRSYDGYGDVETFRNGTGWWLAVQLPLGLDLQVARKGEFFSKLHLFYEVRPMMLFQGSPELGATTSLGLQSVFGLRLKL